MPLLFADDKFYVMCECGNKTFIEENVYLYKKVDGRIKSSLERYCVGKDLVCAKCGKHIEIASDPRLRGLDIIDK
jgi:DNA-directed RNA polymerase subunit RPC12/RpoP